MKDEGANRAALLTPPGASAIAAVRLSGPGVVGFLQAHFSATAKDGRCIHGKLSNGDRVIDDPVVVLSGEGHIADINLHGGEWVVRECLELARRGGFEILESGDELLDARTTLEREMLTTLPAARTEETIRALLDQPRLWAQFKDELNTTSKQALQGRVRQILADRSLWWLLHPPRVAIVGAPNVGKSTLANRLFGQERSITADIPGTTRDWVGDWANLDGLPIHLLDTPGQRDSSDPIEQAAISRSQREIDNADLKILILDPTQPLGGQQNTILDRYPDALIVINKSDLHLAPKPTFNDAVHMSALTGAGVDELQRRIKQHFGIGSQVTSARWWTDRQHKILTHAMDDPDALHGL